MPIGSRRMTFAVGAAFVWLVSIAWATGGTGTHTSASSAGSSPASVNTVSRVFQPACATTSAFAQTGAQAAAPQRASQVSEEAFKNVQLLKGIPVDEFMGTMGLFSAALGMCCLECHNQDWTYDTPRKKTARRMIEMTDTINKTNFSGRRVVTCWTCHRQSDRPYTTPPLDVIYGEPIFWQPDDLFQQAQGAPKPEDVLEKYIQAVGGA